MRLDAGNRTWRNKATAKMARAFDEACMGDEVEELIRASARDGEDLDRVHEYLTQFLYARMCDVYRDLAEDAGPLGCALISDPELDLRIDFSGIASAYLEAFGAKKPKAKGRTSKSTGQKSRPRAIARERASAGRR